MRHDLVALNATTGDPLWHAGSNASVTNGPITYELDGQQYVIVGAGDTLWAFVMNAQPAGATVTDAAAQCRRVLGWTVEVV